jgi:hypothetical protein
MKTKVFFLAALLCAASAGQAFAAAPTAPKPEPRVSVIFVEPQKFTDVKYDSWSDNSPDLLDQIQKFMCETGESYVATGMHLAIKVTDITLAGKFEPWRGPQFDNVRIVRAIYPPSFKLEFRLTDGKGNVVKEGTREISDLAFEMRTAWPLNDYLRYEKDILRDWFRDEFGRLRKS